MIRTLTVETERNNKLLHKKTVNCNAKNASRRNISGLFEVRGLMNLDLVWVLQVVPIETGFSEQKQTFQFVTETRELLNYSKFDCGNIEIPCSSLLLYIFKNHKGSLRQIFNSNKDR